MKTLIKWMVAPAVLIGAMAFSGAKEAEAGGFSLHVGHGCYRAPYVGFHGGFNPYLRRSFHPGIYPRHPGLYPRFVRPYPTFYGRRWGCW